MSYATIICLKISRYELMSSLFHQLSDLYLFSRFRKTRSQRNSGFSNGSSQHLHLSRQPFSLPFHFSFPPSILRTSLSTIVPQLTLHHFCHTGKSITSAHISHISHCLLIVSVSLVHQPDLIVIKLLCESQYFCE